MKRLTLNREFLMRHLGVCLLMFGLSGWFAYDAFVTYPQTDAAALYESIEKAAPGERVDLESFKRQKIQTQYGFAALSLLAALAVGLHLLAVARFRFSYDETGFDWKGKRYALSDITSVDRTQWGKGKKGLLVLTVGGIRITLDAWHHQGVAAFEKTLM